MATEAQGLRERLASVSRGLGAEVSAIQGGGGNTSLKLDADTMLVKASGRTLAGIDAETGFIAVDWRRLAAALPACVDEADYVAALSACRTGGAGRPSIETGLHALLGTCVLHSHSSLANVLACAEQGEVQASRLLPEAAWVPYATPGVALMHQLAAAIGSTRPQVLILQNHGLVVSAETPEAALAMHAQVEARIRAALPPLPPFPSAAVPGSGGLLFPDQAVYLLDPALAASRAGQETLRAVAFLRAAIPAAGLTVRTLDPAEQVRLTKMESEKYRQGMAR